MSSSSDKADFTFATESSKGMFTVPAGGSRDVVLAFTPTQAITRGCGKRLVFAHMCHSDGSGCDWYSVKQLRLEPLLTRAAYEMHCPKEQLTTRQLAPDTDCVNGCGAQGTYVWSCHHAPEFYSSTCTWVLNNSDQRLEAAPSK